MTFWLGATPLTTTPGAEIERHMDEVSDWQATGEMKFGVFVSALLLVCPDDGPVEGVWALRGGAPTNVVCRNGESARRNMKKIDFDRCKFRVSLISTTRNAICTEPRLSPNNSGEQIYAVGDSNFHEEFLPRSVYRPLAYNARHLLSAKPRSYFHRKCHKARICSIQLFMAD